jgi:hypothetical protein
MTLDYAAVTAATLIVSDISSSGRPAGLCFVENADGDQDVIGGFFATNAGWTFVRANGETEEIAADGEFPGLGTALMQWFGKAFIGGDLPFILGLS